MSNREKYQYTMSFVADIASLLCSAASAFLTFGLCLRLIPQTYTQQDYLKFFLMLALSFAASFAFFDKNEDLTARTPGQEAAYVVRFNVLLAAVLAVLMLVTKTALLDSRYLFLGLILWNVFFMQLFHAMLKRYLRSSDIQNSAVRLVGVLTTADRAPALVADLQKDWSKHLHGIALLDGRPEEIGTRIDGVQVRAVYGDFMDWVRRDALDEVYLDLPYDSGDTLLPYLRELESMGLDIHFNVPLLESLYKNADKDGYAPRVPQNMEKHGASYMISLSATHHSMRDMALKRLMDIAGSVVGLALSVPIIAVVAVPLKLESPGPLFFRQRRVGLNGRYFYIYKLRSMYSDAEARKKELMAQNEMNGLMFKMTDDPRITRVGRFIRRTSIDELPQFWNVLRGDMSLVGTRPPTVDEYNQYQSHHKRRLSMKPGITGLWQVSGRSNIEDFEDVVRMDVQYIDNWSLALDVKILLKTIWVVFAGRGAK